MPMISFSGETSQGPFWKQIQSGKKTQTVRRPRKNPIGEGDTLYLYWKVRVPKDKKPIHLIHTAVCTRVRRLTYITFAFGDAFAERDGFRDHHELQEWFGDPFLSPETEYVVIEWILKCPECGSKMIERRKRVDGGRSVMGHYPFCPSCKQEFRKNANELYPSCLSCRVMCGIDNSDQWICPNCNRILGQATPDEAQAIARALYGMEEEV